MSTIFNTDLNLDNVSRVINSLDPVNAQDLTTKSWVTTNAIELVFNTFTSFPATGQTNYLYIATDSNLVYRWNGTTYVSVSGGGSSTAATKLITTVYNISGVTLPAGSVIYLDGAHGFLPAAYLAKADAEATSSKTYGLVISDINDNSIGTVVHSGLIENLNTFGLTEGAQLYLSPTVAGGYTETKPSAPNHIVFIGVCTRAHPIFGTIEVSIQNGYQLDELHDVNAITPVDKVILRYNSTTMIWNASTDFTTIETKVNDNDGMGARIVPNSGSSLTIGANYESVVTRRMFIYGRLILKGRLSVLF